MVSNHAFRARWVAGLALSIALAACSSLHGERHATPSASPDVTPSAAPAANGDMTATEAAVAAAPAQATAEPAPVPVINPNAPMTYTVKRGDTLWGIASMFLRDPWDWPEVWYINPHIRNPHLIYPGDTLALAYGSDGRPQIRLVESSVLRLEPRLRSKPITAAIPTIPYSSIAAFLERPAVLTKDEVRRAPHIIAFRDDHQIAGSDNIAYISSLGPAPHARYSVIEISQKLRDPDTGRVLGYLGLYTATALVSQPATNPARVRLIDTARETLLGDKLISTDIQMPLNLEPRAPSRQVRGKIAWIEGDTGISDLAGLYDIVVINRGSNQGLEPGNVLEVDQAGEVVRDLYGTYMGSLQRLGSVATSLAPRVRLPDERSGTLLVFKTYPRMSFALVVGASNTIAVGDPIHNP